MSLYQRLHFIIGIFVLICTRSSANAQEQDTAQGLSSISPLYIRQVSSKADMLAYKLNKQTAKVLRRYRNLETRIIKKIAVKDSARAATFVKEAEHRYKQLEEKLKQPSALEEYSPGLDSMKSALVFLQQNPQLLSGINKNSKKLKDVIDKTGELEGQFQKAEELKRFLSEKKNYLEKELQSLGLVKELKKLNKEIFYYGEYLREYKSILCDHKRAERKALELLSKIKAFQEFMKKNSYLSQLFNLPGNYSSPQSLTGLQTRAQVQQLVAQQIGTAPVNGVDPRQYVQSQMQQAQQQLNQLKDKIKFLDTDGGSGDTEMPDFRVNKLRTRPFIKRLEYGFDLQNLRSTRVLPVTTDFSFTIGYKIRNGIQAGLGSGYKMGWGSGFRNLKLTNQGLNFRSYIEAKARASIWISGGFEYNYMKEFKKLRDITNPDIWQKSALIGVSKRWRIAKSKQGNIQLLFDILAKKQVPAGQSVKLRFGYRF
jgi:hypothetical protein